MYCYYIVMQTQTLIINQNININSDIERNYNGMIHKSIVYTGLYEDFNNTLKFIINFIQKIIYAIKKKFFPNKKKIRKSYSNFKLNNYENDNLIDKSIEEPNNIFIDKLSDIDIIPNEVPIKKYIPDKGGTLHMDIKMNINVNINIFNTIKNFRKNNKAVYIDKSQNKITQSNLNQFKTNSCSSYNIQPHKEIYLSVDKAWGWFVDIESQNLYNQ